MGNFHLHVSPRPWLREEQDLQTTASVPKTRGSQTYYYGDYPVRGGETDLSRLARGTGLVLNNLPRQWQTDPCGVTLFLQSRRQSIDDDDDDDDDEEEDDDDDDDQLTCIRLPRSS